VQRQPFGGWKKSSLGPGNKAGGPNYVNLFTTLADAPGQTETYQQWWNDYFSIEHDPSALRCESNHLRYRPCRGVMLRLEKDDPATIARAKSAADICGVRLMISLGTEESESQLAARLPRLVSRIEFLRTVQSPGKTLLTAAYDAGINWINAPVLASGRYELPRWLREQSVSQTQHRYGLITETA
jgi:RHH-type proline utilization regulon transcriptional repressor/proline dehydrogenase/delta 1-pyrroline-5-carboxylate dehydrogenase